MPRRAERRRPRRRLEGRLPAPRRRPGRGGGERRRHSLKTVDAMYVHLKGPDEFGHDGDAKGKKRNLEEIDRRFFGVLAKEVSKVKNPVIVVSGDHSTPCIKKAHSDDPVPVLVSGNGIKQDGSARFTENYAKRGGLGLMMGVDVISKVLKLTSDNTNE
ncbi:MAG TPA: hypothetical protein VFP44_02395 [Usitatibacter sp.]|nr:hypothetical protein [Usitatibacter sp.]